MAHKKACRLMHFILAKYTFTKSNEKQKFIQYIKEGLNILKNRPYDIVSEFDSPLYKTAIRMIQKGEDESFVKLFSWYKYEKNKQIVIKDGTAYYKAVFDVDNNKFELISIPLFAQAKVSYVENNQYVQVVEIYGDKINTITSILIRDKNNLYNDFEVPIVIKDNIGTFKINYSELNILKNSLFAVFIRYDGHHLLNIKRTLENKFSHKERDFTFYTTKAGNLGLSIKNK